MAASGPPQGDPNALSAAQLAVVLALAAAPLPVAWFIGSHRVDAAQAELNAADAAEAEVRVVKRATPPLPKATAPGTPVGTLSPPGRPRPPGTPSAPIKESEAPKSDAPKSDAPRSEAPSADAPKQPAALVGHPTGFATAVDRAESAASQRLTLAVLNEADAIAQSGKPADQARMREMLDQCSRLLNGNQREQIKSLAPVIEARVGVLLTRYGPLSNAAKHLKRALAAKETLPAAHIIDAQYALLAAELWGGTRADVKAAATDLPAIPPELPLADRLRMLEIASDGLPYAQDGDKSAAAYRARIEACDQLVRQAAPGARRQLQRAIELQARRLEANGRLQEAEALVRKHLKSWPADESDGTRCLLQARLGSTLQRLGRMDECKELTEEIAAATLSRSLPADVLADHALSEFLVARQHWAAAECALKACWESTIDPMARPSVRQWAALALSDLYQQTDRAQLKETWKRTYDEMISARQARGLDQ